MHRRPTLLPFFPTPAERRRATLAPLDLALRLRLGGDLFPGFTSDLSAGGFGLRIDPSPHTAPALDRALASHERGAVEVFLADMRRMARVRLVRIQPSRDGLLAVRECGADVEAERLIRWLRHYGLLSIDPDVPQRCGEG